MSESSTPGAVADEPVGPEHIAGEPVAGEPVADECVDQAVEPVTEVLAVEAPRPGRHRTEPGARTIVLGPRTVAALRLVRTVGPLALVATTLAACTTSSAPPAPPTARVERASVSTAVSSAGSLTAITEQNLGFVQAGQLKTVAVQVGQRVTAGQVLATLDDTTLRHSLVEQQGQLDSQRAALALQVNATTVRGATNSTGQAQAVLSATQDQRSATIDAAKSAVDRAEKQLNFDEDARDDAQDRADDAEKACDASGGSASSGGSTTGSSGGSTTGSSGGSSTGSSGGSTTGSSGGSTTGSSGGSSGGSSTGSSGGSTTGSTTGSSGRAAIDTSAILAGLGGGDSDDDDDSDSAKEKRKKLEAALKAAGALAGSLASQGAGSGAGAGSGTGSGAGANPAPNPAPSNSAPNPAPNPAPSNSASNSAPNSACSQVGTAQSAAITAERQVVTSRTALDNARNQRDIDQAAQTVSVENARQNAVTAQNNLESARTDRPSLIGQQRGLVTAQEALVRQAQKNVDDTVLRAPADGTVTAVNGAVGEFLTAGSTTTPLAPGSDGAIPGAGTATGAAAPAGTVTRPGGTQFLVLDNVDRFEVVVPFEESDAVRIAPNQRVNVGFDAIPDLTLPGTVTAVSPSATALSGVISYYATVTLDQSDPRLKNGQTAQAAVLTDELDDVLTVPNAAVRREGGKSTVIVQGFDGQRTVEFQPGVVGDDRTQVVSGLTAGDEVVVPSGQR